MGCNTSMALPQWIWVVRSHRLIPITILRLAPRFYPGLHASLSRLRQLVVFVDWLSLGSAVGVGIAERNHTAYLRCQILNHVASELLLLSLILDDKAFLIVLVHI